MKVAKRGAYIHYHRFPTRHYLTVLKDIKPSLNARLSHSMQFWPAEILYSRLAAAAAGLPAVQRRRYDVMTLWGKGNYETEELQWEEERWTIKHTTQHILSHNNNPEKDFALEIRLRYYIHRSSTSQSLNLEHSKQFVVFRIRDKGWCNSIQFPICYSCVIGTISIPHCSQ